MSDAETLLLVYNEKPQLRQLHIVRQDAMRPDQNVNVAFFAFLDHGFLFLCASKPRQEIDVRRKRRKPLAERFVMLVRKNGCRRKDRHLLAVHDRFERCPHRNLRFSVSDIADYQAIHRSGSLHILLYIVDRRGLIDRKFVWKRILKLSLPRRVGRKRVARNKFSLRIKPQKLIGHVAHRAFCLCLRLLPPDATKAIERWGRRLARRISRNEIHSLNRDEELCVVGVDEQHEFALTSARVDGLKRLETADAVIDMNDIVARFQIAKIRDERPEPVLRSPLPQSRGSLGVLNFAEDIGLGEDLETGTRYFEPGRQLADLYQLWRKCHIVLAKDLLGPFSQSEGFHREKRRQGFASQIVGEGPKVAVEFSCRAGKDLELFRFFGGRKEKEGTRARGGYTTGRN